MGETQGMKPGAVLLGGMYKIERVLGQGGFGITYLATDLSLDRLVAIKEFFPKDFCDREATTSHVTLGTKGSGELVNKMKVKFLKEARNIAKLSHPGIIKIHAAFEENNTAYYVMEYIEGGSLSERIKRDGPLSEAKAVEYITKVGHALEYVHERKINHLDVKPANIMVRRGDNEPILIDFGLSKQYDAEGNQTSTTPTGLSHGYAPIEQYNAGGVKEFSPQADIYSLGATLYYLLSGVVPPQATSLIADPLTFPQSIPSGLVPVISKAMSLNKKERYGSVQEFLKELSLTMEKSTIRPKETIDDTVFPEAEIKKQNDPKALHSSNEKKTDSTSRKRFVWLFLAGVVFILVCVILISKSCGNTDSVQSGVPVDSMENISTPDNSEKENEPSVVEKENVSIEQKKEDKLEAKVETPEKNKSVAPDKKGSDESSSVTNGSSTSEDTSEDEIYASADQQPEFPGDLTTYLRENIRYPATAQENGIQGRVICSFVVNKDGSIVDVKVVRGVDSSLDKEAIRLIQNMPNWRPGKLGGKAVRVKYTLPVVFRLTN
jgi:TonB family protein